MKALVLEGEKRADDSGKSLKYVSPKWISLNFTIHGSIGDYFSCIFENKKIDNLGSYWLANNYSTQI